MPDTLTASSGLSGRFPRVRVAVAAAFVLNGLLLGCWASRVPAIVAKFELSEGTLGVLLLSMGLGALISFPVAGRQADRHGAYHLTILLAGVNLVGLLGIGLAPGVVLLGVALFLFGMGHGAMDVTMNSWAAEVERGMGRSVMSSFHAMWSLGAGLGALGGWYATRLHLPVEAHFTLAVVLTALLLGPVMRTNWASRRNAQPAGNPRFALPRGPLVLVGLVALAAGLGEGAAADWSAVYLSEVVQVTPSLAALGYTVYSATMVIMRLNVDALITRHGPEAVARFSGISAACGYGLAVGFATLPTTLAGFVLMGMGYAAVVPLAFSRAAADPDIPSGQAIASVATLGYGALLMGPPLIGFVAEATSLRVSLLLVGCLALMIAVLAPVLKRR